MNSTIGSTSTAPKNSVASASVAIDVVVERPYTLVLQPAGVLDQTSSIDFRRSLEQALESVTDSVIIDFMWVEGIESQGIAALVAGVERAAILGKSILFQSMDSRTRQAMESEWEHQRMLRFGCWNSVFAANLEQFLDSLAD